MFRDKSKSKAKRASKKMFEMVTKKNGTSSPGCSDVKASISIGGHGKT